MKPLLIMINLKVSLIMTTMLNNWFMLFFALEINLLIFISIIFNKSIKSMNKTMMNYFIIQNLSSTLIIFMLINLDIFKIFNNYILIMTIILALFMKMGLVPFQSWYIKIMNSLSFINCFILMSIQKIIPLTLIMFINNNYEMPKILINLMIIFNSFLSTILGINQIYIKSIMAYSSINFQSWLMIIIINNQELFYWFFMLYSIINLSLIITLNKFNILNINKLFMLTPYSFILFSMTFFSLNMYPPFMGFIIKMKSMEFILNLKSFMLPMTILSLFSLLSLYFYMKLMIPQFLMFFKTFKSINNLYKLNKIKMKSLTLLSFFFLLMNKFLE